MITQEPDARTLLEVLPAVDLLGDDAVRLRQGEYADVVHRLDPLDLVARYRDAGARTIHLVDLVGARDGLLRPDVVRRIARIAEPVPIQASGGVRSVDDAKLLLEAGATRVVVGTAAFADEAALGRLTGALGERLVVALDIRDGVVALEGWTRETSITVTVAAARCREAGVHRVLCTAIERDGTLEGPDLPLLEALTGSGLSVLAAGGVRSLDDLAAIAETGCEGAVVGRALLEGRVPLSALRHT